MDKFKVEYNIHPASDDGHRYRLKMDIWDENNNFYESILIREYSNFDRAVAVQEMLFRASYTLGDAFPWE